MSEPLRVRVHYDFASTLCYVAHRVMGRLTDELACLGIELVWSPLDLARLLPRRRGEPLPEPVLRNAARVARELDVPVRVPGCWIDSRDWLAGALLAEREGRGPAYRERVWTRLYEEPAGRTRADGDGPTWGAAALRAARDELDLRTEEAAAQLVTGVPTFMLGSWPFGGIQEEATMRAVLRRYASRARQGRLL